MAPGRSQDGRALEQLTVAENAPDDGALREGGQHSPPAPAAWAGEDMKAAQSGAESPLGEITDNLFKD